jgi:hypothetical protein
MNSTAEEEKAEIECSDILFYKIIFVYGGKVTYYGTVLTTFICTIVFTIIVYSSSNKSDNKSQMYKYFLMRSLFDCIAYVITLPEVDYYNGNNSDTYAWQVWFIWIYYYSFYVAVSVSNYMEVAATLDCYLLVKNKFLFLLKNQTFCIVFAVLLVFNILINIHYTLMFDIVENGLMVNGTLINSSITSERSSYTLKSFFSGVNTSLSVYREILPLIFLLILNAFILAFIKEATVRKKRVQTVNNSTNQIQKAETNKIKMIVAVSLSYIILRTPFAFYDMALHPSTTFWECYYFAAAIRLYDVSFGIQIFIYYSFNKKFKNCLITTLRLNRITNTNRRFSQSVYPTTSLRTNQTRK